MTGSRVVVGLGVVVRAVVLVADEETDRGSEGVAGFDAGLKLDGVLLVTLQVKREEER